MAVPDRAKEATTQFLKAQFHRYYDGSKPTLPDRFGRREFGFMFWTAGIVQRHLGFSKEADLHSFLSSRVPTHAYYSSAYYETPNAPTMEEKGWLGADLIFDLDADHLPGAQSMTYPEMLEAIRLKIVKLYDEFLVEDFGVDVSNMRIVFSGGRGYHIHVRDPRVLTLGSHERREIVDWIFGTAFDTRSAFKETVYDTKQFKTHAYSKKKVIIERADLQTGWPRKVIRGLLGLADLLEPMDRQQAVDFLASAPNIKKEEAEKLWENLFKARGPQGIGLRGVDRLRSQKQIEVLTDRNVALVLEILQHLFQTQPDVYQGVSLEHIKPFGDTDQPVTSDIKRLIRLPSSLHGKTGLQVVPVTRDAIDDFRPLRDAVPRAWTDEPVRMNLRNKISMEIRGDVFNLAPGVNDVPQYLAIFLAARGLATVVPEA